MLQQTLFFRINLLEGNETVSSKLHVKAHYTTNPQVCSVSKESERERGRLHS